MIIVGTAIVTTQCNRKSNEDIEKRNEEYIAAGKDNYSSAEAYLINHQYRDDITTMEQVYTVPSTIGKAHFTDDENRLSHYFHNWGTAGTMEVYIDVTNSFFYPKDKLIRNTNNQYGVLQIQYDPQYLSTKTGYVSAPYPETGELLEYGQIPNNVANKMHDTAVENAMAQASTPDNRLLSEKQLVKILLQDAKSFQVEELYLNNIHIENLSSLNLEAFVNQNIK